MRTLVGAAEPGPQSGPQISLIMGTTTSSITSVLFSVSYLTETAANRGPIRVQARVGRPIPEIGGAR